MLAAIRLAAVPGIDAYDMLIEPDVALSRIAPTRFVSSNLTIVAMAALGLSADVRTVARAGSRVIAAVSLSLLLLVVLGIVFIHVLNIR